MRTRGAVAGRKPGVFDVVDLELDEPRAGEIMVRMAATGLCHSDDHVAKADMPVGIYPFCGGHEGAGIVEAVGPSTDFEVGDHVVFSMLASCGRCRWCASGMQNLCDKGAVILQGGRPEDPASYRMHLTDGTPVGQMCGISTFSEHTTASALSAIKVDKDLPLDKLCLLGCGVGTGWGSAVNSAAVRPGDTVIVMGVGGIGINAVQGAAHAGATHLIAVDPVEFKRSKALEFGATDVFDNIEDADVFARSVTNGQGADSAIVTIGVVKGEHIAAAVAAIRKAGTVVLTGLGNINDIGIPISFAEFTLYQKRIQGSVFGQCNPTSDIPRQIEMYRSGQLKLDELVTQTYTLDDLPKGYEDMHAGLNLRGVVVFE